MRTATAGTLESMDCMVTVSAGSGVSVEITGAGAARFGTAMVSKVRSVLERLGATDVSVSVQDNGALDIVLGARVEAAWVRYTGGEA